MGEFDRESVDFASYGAGFEASSLIDDGGLWWMPGWLSAESAAEYLGAVREEIHWQDEHLVLFGRLVRVPRQVAWIGDPGCDYRYSGVTHVPSPWTPTLAELRARLNDDFGLRLNAVLGNRYRDGSEHMGWHSDDEKELGPEPVLASLSLGATRRFLMRHRRDRRRRFGIDLAAGDLLIMAGGTQDHWQHRLAPTRRAVGERINLTFRRIVGA